MTNERILSHILHCLLSSLQCLDGYSLFQSLVLISIYFFAFLLVKNDSPAHMQFVSTLSSLSSISLVPSSILSQVNSIAFISALLTSTVISRLFSDVLFFLELKLDCTAPVRALSLADRDLGLFFGAVMHALMATHRACFSCPVRIANDCFKSDLIVSSRNCRHVKYIVIINTDDEYRDRKNAETLR